MPCLNGGVCMNNPMGGFTCTCTPPFGGTKCEKGELRSPVPVRPELCVRKMREKEDS